MTGASPRAEAASAKNTRHPLIYSDWFLFAIVFVVALAVRLIYVFEMKASNPVFGHPMMDELYHDQWATAIAQGRDFVNGPYFRAPLYPYFLGGIYKVFGHGYLAPRVAQAFVGALNCGLLFLIGRITFNKAIGFVAGIVAATYLMLVYFDAELLLPVL